MTPRIRTIYESGSESVTKSPRYALMYWLIEQNDKDEITTLLDKFGSVELHVSDEKVIGHDHPQLITVAISAIERRWNKTPDIPESMTDLDEQSWFILSWLEQNGDITNVDKEF